MSSKRKRTSKGRKRNRPARRLRSLRPGVSFRLWQSAVRTSAFVADAARVEPAGRPRPGVTKRGKLSSLKLTAKLADQGANGVVAITESFGDFPHGLFVDQNGTQDFVLALKWITGLQEEGTHECSIHAAISDCGVFFRSDWSKRYLIQWPLINANWGRRTENTSKSCENRQSQPGSNQTYPQNEQIPDLPMPE